MAFGVIANAETIIFQNGLTNALYTDVTGDTTTEGYQGTHDNFVSQYSSNRDFNNGNAAGLYIGNSDWGNTVVGLLKFDLSRLTGKIINGATLEIATDGQYEPNQEFGIYKMKAANAGWIEGSGAGDLAVGGECSWNYKIVDVADPNIGTEWAGGYGPVGWYTGGNDPNPDHEPNALATFLTTGNTGGDYEWFATEIDTSLIQSWAGIDVNDVPGLLIKASNTGWESAPDSDPSFELRSASYVYMCSSEWSDGEVTNTEKPRLTIDYSAAPTSCQEQIDLGYLLPGDISGPAGLPDCQVNMYDFAEIAENWTVCVDPADPVNCIVIY